MSEDLSPALAALLEQLVERIARRLLELQAERRSEHDPEERSPWMGSEQAARYLGWPRQRLYKLTARGQIPHVKQDGRLLFHRAELDHWLHGFAQGGSSGR